MTRKQEPPKVSLPNPSLSYVNLDYLRVTSSTGYSLSVFANDIRETFFPDEVLRTYQGGFYTPSVKYASNRQSKMVDVNGDKCDKVMAWILEYMAAPLSDGKSRFTRVDYCLDLRLPETHQSLANDWYDLGVGSDCRRSQEGETLYFASRVSPVFGRMYDKSARYGSPLGSVWRFEIEGKRVQSRRLASSWAQSDNPTVHIGQVISHHFAKWGVLLPMTGKKLQSEAVIHGDDRTVTWLRKSVAPSIARLVAAGKGELVKRALGEEVESLYHQGLLL